MSAFSFVGGVSEPRYSPVHPVVVFIKAESLIYADLGDRGAWHEAEWMLASWVERIVAEGYVLLFAGLVLPEVKPSLEDMAERIAKMAKISVVRSAEWSG